MKFRSLLLAMAATCLIATPASAALVSVSGPASNLGTLAEILAVAPADVNDDAATNTGLQGFNEIQDFVLTSDLSIDGGSIGAGTRVDSHMIFLNTAGNTFASHGDVDWTFDGDILGTLSNFNGSLEVASSGDLGAPGTIYPLAAFAARGLEGNDDISFVGNVLTTNFRVTEPGDWVRVITASPVPLPAALPLFATGLGLIGFMAARRKRKENSAA